LKWDVRTEEIQLQWHEIGGPPAKKPAKEGFGTRIIKASIEHQLGGKTRFVWRPQGLQCLLTVPLGDTPVHHTTRDFVREMNDDVREIHDDNSNLRTSTLTGDRIMIVEDEALIAMAMSDLVTELGFKVVGPYSNLKDAMAALKGDGVDGAILDINIGGELIYPLADILIARNLPFIFTTGYGKESIASSYENIQVLHKPVERKALRQIFVRSDKQMTAAM
jgi:CheY-like chemotaxis protein